MPARIVVLGGGVGGTLAANLLSKELGRSPNVREVAEHLGCSAEQVLEAQEAAASYEAAKFPTLEDQNTSKAEVAAKWDSVVGANVQ